MKRKRTGEPPVTGAETNLRQQLEAWIAMRRLWCQEKGCSFPYVCNEDLVLRHGRSFRRSPEPPPVEPIARACYFQAYKLATRARSKWIYCEGFAATEDAMGLAVMHAWVVSADAPDVARELAWRHGTPENTAYLGIAFDAAFVREMHRAAGRKLLGVLDVPWANYPLLTGERPIEDVLWRPR
jgi:hypothetical protein